MAGRYNYHSYPKAANFRRGRFTPAFPTERRATAH